MFVQKQLPSEGTGAASADDALARKITLGASSEHQPHRQLRFTPIGASRRRAVVPVFAGVVPLIAGLILWLVLKTPFALIFALLGPVIMFAGLADTARVRRRQRRADEELRGAELTEIGDAIVLRHEQALHTAVAACPDVTGLLHAPERIWRTTAHGQLCAGRGVLPSGVVVEGVDDDERVRQLAERAQTLRDAPIALEWRGGVWVSGPPVLREAALRALVMQVALRFPPGTVVFRGPFPEPFDWLTLLPHAAAAPVDDDTLAVAIRGSADALDRSGHITFRWGGPGEAVAPDCASELMIADLNTAEVRAEGRAVAVAPEFLSDRQAREIATALARLEAAGARAGAHEEPPALRELCVSRPRRTGGLPVCFAAGEHGPVAVDIVTDGPHAVAAGVTGAGKSELLRSWALALCAGYGSEEAVLLLADFKGGTAFNALRDLPQVVGLITDLDPGLAARAIASLRAEIRHRERTLLAAGKRDIGEIPGLLPRLVIMIDEFAALTDEHRDLVTVFGDIAARGRALGMHLIIGVQRVTGVVSDALLANCPLRIGLRMTDRYDATHLLGRDGAAQLPAGPGGRGAALLRRNADADAFLVRIALSDESLIAEAAQRFLHLPAPRAVWLPEPGPGLPPEHLSGYPSGDDLRGAQADAAEDIPIGLRDLPQEQTVVRFALPPAGLIVVGGPGSGKSTVVSVAEQQGGAKGLSVLRLSCDREQAWDELVGLTADGAVLPDLLLCDDLDLLLGSYPPEYAELLVGRLEVLLRGAAAYDLRALLTAQTLPRSLHRITDLIGSTAMLPGVGEHTAIALGMGPGRAANVHPAVPGRACIGGDLVQFAHVPLPPAGGRLRSGTHVGVGSRRAQRALRGSTRAWRSDRNGSLTAIVTPNPDALLQRLIAEGQAAVRISAATGTAELRAGDRIVVGDPMIWQQHWSILATFRAQHEILIDAACERDYRTLTGSAERPPYAHPGRGRAWQVRPGYEPRRVYLPQLDPRTGAASFTESRHRAA